MIPAHWGDDGRLRNRAADPLSVRSGLPMRQGEKSVYHLAQCEAKAILDLVSFVSSSAATNAVTEQGLFLSDTRSDRAWAISCAEFIKLTPYV